MRTFKRDATRRKKLHDYSHSSFHRSSILVTNDKPLYVMPRRVRDYFTVTLRAARNGAYDEFDALASNIETLPPDILPEVLEIFIYQLKGRQCQPDEYTADMLTMAAMKGLHKLTRLSEFQENPFYARRILHSWARDLVYTISFLSKLKKRNQDDLLDCFSSYTIDIFNQILFVDEQGLNRVLENHNVQGIICDIWLNRPLADSHAISSTSVLLGHCLEVAPSSLKTLTDQVNGDFPEEEISKKAVSRLFVAYSMLKRMPELWTEVQVELSIIRFFIDGSPTTLGLSLVKNRCVSLALKVMRLCMARIPIQSVSVDSHATHVVKSCFAVFRSFFGVDTSIVRKAVRGGFVRALFYFSRYIDFWDGLDDILSHQLPNVLVFPKDIDAMAQAFQAITPELRKQAEKVNHSWALSQLENLLIERVIILRIHVASHKIAKCSNVGGCDETYLFDRSDTDYLQCRKLCSKSSLKACGRCLTAKYCSGTCQKIAWQSGHRSVCLETGLQGQAIRNIELGMLY